MNHHRIPSFFISSIAKALPTFNRVHDDMERKSNRILGVKYLNVWNFLSVLDEQNFFENNASFVCLFSDKALNLHTEQRILQFTI